MKKLILTDVIQDHATSQEQNPDLSYRRALTFTQDTTLLLE